MRGTGPLARHWDDEGLLGLDLPRHSDLVALWQAVLWADGYLKRSQIDCRYDESTVRAARVWQSNRGLPADGIIGPDTFGKAGERLTRRRDAVYYEGAKFSVPFRRADDGRYLVEDGGRYKPLHRYRPTLDVCGKRPR
ncbi:peptidoglycan-binding protein [Streptomyces sp. SID14515]|uniref:peptidoglycan-binding protein n=1 Tax=Streptomyces sp. SID14515 TaxID=2706074 RepID=UPI0013C670F6|nr:peptidoglycan-binding protein [Streptomyces sp. SID14515]